MHELAALGVMIKAPRSGAVKTRLVPPLTPEEAAALSACFLQDIAANISSVPAKYRAQGVAVFTPTGCEAELEQLLPSDFHLVPQRGDGFGERLFNAIQDLLSRGFRSAFLIGADSPSLPRDVLETAVALLDRPGDRVVLGAAEDGGYYLVGVKYPHARLFEEINWSTDTVLAESIERAGEINLDVELLPSWFDVDDPATLERLCSDLFSKEQKDGELTGYEAPRTREYLTSLIDQGRIPAW